MSSVRNLCGDGSTSGSASVTVIPRLLTENIATAVCSGKNVEVKFTIGGNLPTNTTFQAQLSDSTGNFATAVSIGTGSSSPIVATIPSNIRPGGNYRIRVIVVGNPFYCSCANFFVFSGTPAYGHSERWRDFPPQTG